MRHVKDQKVSIRCAYWGRGVLKSYERNSLVLDNYENALIQTSLHSSFSFEGGSLVFKGSNLFQIQ